MINHFMFYNVPLTFYKNLVNKSSGPIADGKREV